MPVTAVPRRTQAFPVPAGVSGNVACRVVSSSTQSAAGPGGGGGGDGPFVHLPDFSVGVQRAGKIAFGQHLASTGVELEYLSRVARARSCAKTSVHGCTVTQRGALHSITLGTNPPTGA